MEFGEIYLIENLETGLEEKVRWAAKRFQRKYGHRPTLCALHPSLITGGRRRLNWIKVELRKSLLPNYVWLGIPADMEARPIAR
jgi:hypothetical protein